MAKSPNNQGITDAVRSLDPAPSAALSEAEKERADAMFARIVATAPDEAPIVDPVPRRRSRTRLLGAGGLVGVAGAATVAVMVGGGGSAYGSWTAKPTPITGSAETEAAQTCLEALGAEPISLDFVMAEERGEWTYVLINSREGDAMCVMLSSLIGSDDPEGDRGKGFLGQSGPDPSLTVPSLGPADICESALQGGSTDDGWIEMVGGFAGRDVTAVTIDRDSGPDIEASLKEGRFAAWWPGPPQSSTNPSETWTYRLTLADGSMQTVEGLGVDQSCSERRG